MKWHGHKVFVTGACGFIGSHLVEQLVRNGAEVKALAFYDARGTTGWLEDISPEVAENMDIVSGDVRDAEHMSRSMRDVDTVFHLAALIGIPYSYIAPRSYMETNLSGTLNILEAARNNNVNRTIVVSTSEVYGTAITVPISESHPLQAQSPYSASKIAAEKLAESYNRAFNLPVSVIRPFNTYGPRQSARAVIPTILMQALDNKSSITLGDPDTTRDFNFVLDTVEGMVRIAEEEKAVGKIINIGTGIEHSIADVVRTTAELDGAKLEIEENNSRKRPPASEVRRLCADNSLLKEITAWQPRTAFSDGLRITRDWFKPRLANYDSSKYYI